MTELKNCPYCGRPVQIIVQRTLWTSMRTYKVKHPFKEKCRWSECESYGEFVLENLVEEWNNDMLYMGEWTIRKGGLK